MGNTTQEEKKDNNIIEKMDAAKELLLADYQYLCESFWRNEEVGETRVKFFITLVTAVLAALVTMTSKADDIHNNVKIAIALYALLSLLTVGIVTFFRIIKRNEVTDGFKKDMDEIRKRFRLHFDENKVLSDYSPFRKPIEDKGSGNTKQSPRKFGGLAHTVAAINSLIVSAFIGIILYYAEINKIIYMVVFVLSAFFMFFYIQCAYLRKDGN